MIKYGMQNTQVLLSAHWRNMPEDIMLRGHFEPAYLHYIWTTEASCWSKRKAHQLMFTLWRILYLHIVRLLRFLIFLKTGPWNLDLHNRPSDQPFRHGDERGRRLIVSHDPLCWSWMKSRTIWRHSTPSHGCWLCSWNRGAVAGCLSAVGIHS